MADSFENPNKLPEAGNSSPSSSPYDFLFQKEEFRVITADEAKHLPLYCVGCRRLLAEAEVYDFRRGYVADVQCWCGATGVPVAKQDARHKVAIDQMRTTGQRAKALSLASKVFPGGKNKMKAGLLALFLGGVGAHKFYLGENIAGLIYLLWCWTFIPLFISIYEALNLFGMSMVNFNMTYNLDIVLSQIDSQEGMNSDKNDIFLVDKSL